jgi:hypothetical protein
VLENGRQGQRCRRREIADRRRPSIQPLDDGKTGRVAERRELLVNHKVNY